mmetsp:Transcript_3033/g.5039  ORF Transcript_3033/g.5039 Transcript_3033/m.5039 type:complete len:346 (-) Transcript_3033:928-1965(-)
MFRIGKRPVGKQLHHHLAHLVDQRDTRIVGDALCFGNTLQAAFGIHFRGQAAGHGQLISCDEQRVLLAQRGVVDTVALNTVLVVQDVFQCETRNLLVEHGELVSFEGLVISNDHLRQGTVGATLVQQHTNVDYAGRAADVLDLAQKHVDLTVHFLLQQRDIDRNLFQLEQVLQELCVVFLPRRQVDHTLKISPEPRIHLVQIGGSMLRQTGAIKGVREGAQVIEPDRQTLMILGVQFGRALDVLDEMLLDLVEFLSDVLVAVSGDGSEIRYSGVNESLQNGRLVEVLVAAVQFSVRAVSVDGVGGHVLLLHVDAGVHTRCQLAEHFCHGGVLQHLERGYLLAETF